jgi:hypothetical protein
MYRGVFLSSNPVGVEESDKLMPKSYSLDQNYPNPFNPSTVIKYAIPENSFVTLKIFDALGREVALLVNSQQSAGVHTVNFNASNLTSGIYFYQLNAKNFSQVKKMMVLR